MINAIIICAGRGWAKGKEGAPSHKVALRMGRKLPGTKESIHSLTEQLLNTQDLVSTQDIDEPDAVLASGLPQIMSKSKWE